MAGPTIPMFCRQKTLKHFAFNWHVVLFLTLMAMPIKRSNSLAYPAGFSLGYNIGFDDNPYGYPEGYNVGYDEGYFIGEDDCLSELSPRIELASANQSNRLVIPGVKAASKTPIAKIKFSNMVTSKEIRDFLKTRLNLQPKMLSQATSTNLKSLGYKISKLTNVKLKTILLRSIHGDIYSGTRLKKFGMTEDDSPVQSELVEEKNEADDLVLDLDNAIEIEE